jgi:hypothetical protein
MEDAVPGEPNEGDEPIVELPSDAPPPDDRSGPRRSAIVLGSIAVVVVVAAVAFFIGRSSSDEASTSTTTTPTTTTPSTSRPSTTTSTTTTSVPSTAGVAAIWPTPASGLTYTDPTAAARGFAVDFVGFTDPVVGSFRAGDSRSGEVDVQPAATGPITTVLVRQLEGTSWSVTGSSTPNIALASPVAMSTITSPVRLTGTSTAFEATVNVEVREDDQQAPIGTGFVMGGSMGDLGPFDGSVEFSAPSATRGALVLVTRSAKDGTISEATVVRVQFAD